MSGRFGSSVAWRRGVRGSEVVDSVIEGISGAERDASRGDEEDGKMDVNGWRNWRKVDRRVSGSVSSSQGVSEYREPPTVVVD